jgi:hypothetical protein
MINCADNLLGAADYTAFKTLEDYALYVNTFVADVAPAVLSMDFYPYFAEVRKSTWAPLPPAYCGPSPIRPDHAAKCTVPGLPLRPGLHTARQN